MRRDMDLIRKMILAVEDHPAGFAPDNFAIEGHSEEEIAYHAYLIVDAGLAEGIDMTSMGDSSPEWAIRNLTWQGHEFADAARDETRWKKAMGIVSEKSGSVTLAVLTQLLTALMRNSLGL
jgi:hypothetical protein